MNLKLRSTWTWRVTAQDSSSSESSSFALDSDTSDKNASAIPGFCIIEDPETVQDSAKMELQEIQDNIWSWRNKIFLHMEELELGSGDTSYAAFIRSVHLPVQLRECLIFQSPQQQEKWQKEQNVENWLSASRLSVRHKSSSTLKRQTGQQQGHKPCSTLKRETLRKSTLKRGGSSQALRSSVSCPTLKRETLPKSTLKRGDILSSTKQSRLTYASITPSSSAPRLALGPATSIPRLTQATHA